MAVTGKGKAFTGLMIATLSAIFCSVSTYAIYDLVPSEYFASNLRFMVGAFLSSFCVSLIVYFTCMSANTEAVKDNA